MKFLCVFLLAPLLSLAQQKQHSNVPLSKPVLSPAKASKGKQLNTLTSQQLSISDHPSPLSIGDTLLAGRLNPKFKIQNTQLVILDFWATWCTSCLRSFSKLDSLQQSFDNRMQVILVNEKGTNDNDKTVAAYFNRHRKKDGGKYSFASVLYDTVLTQFFPHQLLPHYVWLDNNLKVLAITPAEELTAQNIQLALNGKSLDLPVKRDNATYDVSLPLLHKNNGVLYSSAVFQSVLTSRLPGFGTFGKKWSDGISQKITWVNHSIITLYQFAFGFNGNRLVIDAALLDSLSNQFCSYELIAPAALSKQELNNIFAQDLNRYLGLNGRWQKKQMPCYVLQRSAFFDSSLVQTKGTAPRLRWLGSKDSVSLIVNQPLSKIIDALNTSLIGSKKPIVVDETGFNQNIDMILHAGVRDLQLLKTELNKYGLDLVPAQRQLEVFVLTRNKNQNTIQPNNNDQ